MTIHPVLFCSWSSQDDLVCSVQEVVAICGLKLGCFWWHFLAVRDGDCNDNNNDIGDDGDDYSAGSDVMMP